MAKKQFRCANVGYTDCGWSLEGDSTEEMILTIEDHACKVHHLELKEEGIEHVRQAIHRAA
jgi:predicted small metal-binding protein